MEPPLLSPSVAAPLQVQVMETHSAEASVAAPLQVQVLETHSAEASVAAPLQVQVLETHSPQALPLVELFRRCPPWVLSCTAMTE